MIYCVDVITADTSTMRDRGLAFAFTSSPYIITAFAGPKAAEGFYANNWRWAFGCFAIVLPVVAAPLYFVLQMNQIRAKRSGLLVKKPSGRTWTQSMIHYAIEFDSKYYAFIMRGQVALISPISYWGHTPRDWPGSLPSPILACRVSSRPVEVGTYYCYARGWHDVFDFICTSGEVHRAKTVHPF
jgi:MFS family permease